MEGIRTVISGHIAQPCILSLIVARSKLIWKFFWKQEIKQFCMTVARPPGNHPFKNFLSWCLHPDCGI